MSSIPLVSANLATVCIESLLYGVFNVLFVTSTYLQVRQNRESQQSQGRALAIQSGVRQSVFARPMFIPGICLYIAVTAHWICTVIRLFQAFVHYDGGSQPLEFYADLAQTTEVVKTGFLMTSLIIGDAMIIYRTWVVWNHRIMTIIFPLCTLTGLTVCGVGITYQFAVYRFGENVFVSQAGRWITSDCVFTLCTNLYCSSMIAWKIWRTNAALARPYVGGRMLHALVIFIESAVLYTTWSLFFMITYQSHTNLQFTIVDTWAVMSGIAYMLINVRVAFGVAHKSQTLSSSGLRSAPRGNEHYVMHPVAVNITQVVDVDDDNGAAIQKPSDAESGHSDLKTPF